MKAFNFVKDKYVNPEYPFKDRLYYLFGTVGVISAGAAFVAAICSDLPKIAATASLISFFIMLVIMVSSLLVKNILINRIVCGIFLNFFMFPVLFWVTGGVNCGMIFFFMLALSVAALILDGKTRTIIIAISLIIDTACFYLGFTHPDWAYPLSYEERMSDTISSFLIVALFIIAVILIMSREYQKEHEQVLAYNAELHQQAITDPMTTLYNQRYLWEFLGEYMASFDREKDAASIVMFDIDDFKLVNDTYGHICGNQVICQFASILKEKSGEKYVAVRYGGEEFLIVMPGLSEKEAFALADEVRIAAYEDELLRQLIKSDFTVSGGVAGYETWMSVEQWINTSDVKLYEAKQTGKNKIIC